MASGIARTHDGHYNLTRRVIRMLKSSVGTLLMELAKIKSGNFVLPTITREGTPGSTVRDRCVTTPDKAQKVLLNRLGLRLPQHLRYLEDVAQMWKLLRVNRPDDIARADYASWVFNLGYSFVHFRSVAAVRQVRQKQPIDAKDRSTNPQE